MTDLLIYRDEGAAVRSGRSLYGIRYASSAATATAHATYPPFAAVLFVPLTYLPVWLVEVAALTGNLALLLIIGVLSARLTGIEAGRRVTVVAGVLILGPWSEPVLTTVRLGQINLLVLVLVLWDFTRPPNARARGVGVGLAAALKVTPAIFIVYLLMTGRRSSATTAVGILLGTIAGSYALLPTATWQFWTRDLFDTGRVGRPENATNQALRGLIARIDHTQVLTDAEVLMVVLVAVGGLGIAVMAYRQLGDEWGLSACAVTALLISPISRSHHWVWFLPIAVVLWEQARPFCPGLLVFWTYVVWALPRGGTAELHYDALEIILSAAYVLFGFAFLALTVSRIWTLPNRLAPAGPGPASSADKR